ncbi:MAG: hypothetical protein QM581_07400 [Pseudomonas sp.]
MNHQRIPPREAWRPSVVRERDIWCDLPDIHVGQRARRTYRSLTYGLMVVLAAVVLLLSGAPFFVLWAIA